MKIDLKFAFYENNLKCEGREKGHFSVESLVILNFSFFALHEWLVDLPEKKREKFFGKRTLIKSEVEKRYWNINQG